MDDMEPERGEKGSRNFCTYDIVHYKKTTFKVTWTACPKERLGTYEK